MKPQQQPDAFLQQHGIVVMPNVAGPRASQEPVFVLLRQSGALACFETIASMRDDVTGTIVHLDADAFFASVEQSADSRLRGKPVPVGGERPRHHRLRFV